MLKKNNKVGLEYKTKIDVWNNSPYRHVIVTEIPKEEYGVRLYLEDLYTAVAAWFYIWWIAKPRVERYIIFIETGIHESRQKRLPCRLLMKAFRTRLKFKSWSGSESSDY